jgi:hypothetical protein
MDLKVGYGQNMILMGIPKNGGTNRQESELLVGMARGVMQQAEVLVAITEV